MKSDTLDSSTMSSIDTDASVLRKMPNFPTKKYSSSDDSDSDSDFGSSTSARRKRVRSRPLRPKRQEPKTKDASYDETTSSDSDTEKEKSKTNGKIEDSSSMSSDSDDDSLVKKSAKLPVKARTLTKKKKGSESSDSDAKTASRRSSTETPPPPPKKVVPKIADKKVVKEKTPLRASQRNAVKVDEIKPEEKNEDSSDSEAPLAPKKKTTDLVRDILMKFSTNRATSDSDSKSNKIESGSDSDEDKKVLKPAKEPEKKQVKCKKDIKEEHKEETLVSSSSQEPITRSIAVQTEAFSRVSNLPDLKHRPDRISELEKELQMQAKTNRLLEMEFDKTKVLIERMRSDHDDEISEINARHLVQVSEIKKKQWVGLRFFGKFGYWLFFLVLQLRNGGHLSLLLEYCVLQCGVSTSALAVGAQACLSEKTVNICGFSDIRVITLAFKVIG